VYETVAGVEAEGVLEVQKAGGRNMERDPHGMNETTNQAIAINEIAAIYY
jgi:hypothetical protein